MTEVPHEETLPTQMREKTPAVAVKTFLVATHSDAGPKLLAFRISSLLIGRLPDNHLALNHSSVSRRHARLTLLPHGVFVEDMGSQNGTTINGVRVPTEKKMPLKPGDILRIGHVPLFYFGFIRPESPPEIESVEHAISLTPLLSDTL